MAQATTFYLPFFNTGVPNGKLYTYITNTDTPAPTYSDSTGTLNDNPITLDNDGKCVLYIDSDITYRYVLYNEDGRQWDENNIAQLKGKPGAPGGPKGPKGDRGRVGNKGISGPQGPEAYNVPGDKGPPFLTQLKAVNNQNLIIPAGVDAVYITASAGGGGAASWSDYTYLVKSIYEDSPSQPNTYTLNAPFKRVSDGYTTFSNNANVFKYIRFQTLSFMPGSGFAGQSVYRQRIPLDKTRSNTLFINIGVGGGNDTTTLNGLPGTDTTVYLNGNKVLELKGGLAGKNSFPMNDSQIPTLPTDGSAIRLNKGFTSGLIIGQYSDASRENYSTPLEGQKLFSFDTSYRANDGFGHVVIVPIKLSYYTPLTNYSANQSHTFLRTTRSIDQAKGGKGVFGEFITTYGPLDNWYSGYSFTGKKWTIKGGNDLEGWGAGGDVVWNPSGTAQYQSYFGYAQGMFKSEVTNITTFDKTVIQNAFISYCNLFRYADSAVTGTTSSPSPADATFWSGVDAVQTIIDSNPSTYKQVKKSGFYDKICVPNFKGNPDFKGGKGVNGFVYVEYGAIKDN